MTRVRQENQNYYANDVAWEAVTKYGASLPR